MCQLLICGAPESLRPRTHFEVKTMKKHNLAISRCTWESSICHASRDNRSCPGFLPIAIGKKVGRGKIDLLCQITRQRLADS